MFTRRASISLFGRKPAPSVSAPMEEETAPPPAPPAISNPDQENVEEKVASFSLNDPGDSDDNRSTTTAGTTTLGEFAGTTKQRLTRVLARRAPRLSDLLASANRPPLQQEEEEMVSASPSSSAGGVNALLRKTFTIHGRSPSFSVTHQELSEDMNKLVECIASKRKELVNEMLGLDGDVIVKVRFIAAVDQYERCQNKDEKKHMGQKLVDIFIPSSSNNNSQGALTSAATAGVSQTKSMDELGHKLVDMFKRQEASSSNAREQHSTSTIDDGSRMFVINSLSESTCRRLSNGYLSHLADARQEILQELSRNMLVMNAVYNVQSAVNW